MYQNYIFDLYGTLIDINTNERKSSLWQKLCEFYRFHGAYYTPSVLRRSYEKMVKEAFQTAPSNYTYPEIVIDDVFKKLYEEKNVAASKELISHTAQFFRILSTSYIRLYDGALDLLQSLKNHGKKIYVLSNAQRLFTEYEMRHLEIYDIFDGIVLSSDEGCMKPDRAFYETVLKRYKLDPSTSIMIGNDYISDIKGAFDAGLDSLYLHSNLSPSIEGELHATYQLMEIDLNQAKEILINH